MRTEIALLQNVRIASPCSAPWSEMTPVSGDRVRFCGECNKRVYNLSAMGQAEAEGLLRSNEGHLCVRYYRRTDGTILTSDCPIGLLAARRMVLMRTQVTVGVCLLLCVAWAAGYRETTGQRYDARIEAPRPKEDVMGKAMASQEPTSVSSVQYPEGRLLMGMPTMPVHDRDIVDPQNATKSEPNWELRQRKRPVDAGSRRVSFTQR